VIPGVRSLLLAHPGLPYLAASRLVDADIHIDAVLSSRYSIGATGGQVKRILVS